MNINEELNRLAKPILGSYEVPRAAYDYILNNKKKDDIDYCILSMYSDLLPSRLDDLLGSGIYNDLVLNIQHSVISFVDKNGDSSKDLILDRIKDQDILEGIKFIFNLTKLDNKDNIINLVDFKVDYWTQLLKDVFSPSLEKMSENHKANKVELLKDTLELFNVIKNENN